MSDSDSQKRLMAFRSPIEQHHGTIRVRVDVQREGDKFWARAVPDPVRPSLMPLASGTTCELAIEAACEAASIAPPIPGGASPTSCP